AYQSPQAEAAFTAAAARFFELLKSFAAQPPGAPGQTPDWTSFGATLASQFEQWLRSAPAAAAAFGGTAFGGAAAWPPGPVPLGPAAAPGADATVWDLLMKLGQLQGELAQHWSEIAKSAAELFLARLRTGSPADLSSEGALALYETWVECAEEAYAATVRGEDFAHLQAQLTNTAMALLLAQRRQAESLARAWGLPTREETDALQRQIRELKEQLEQRAPRPAGRRAAPAASAASAARRRATKSAPKRTSRRRGTARRGRR
ncbi:MAG TPA: poly(R)-hydroxyalkanoic acid synthase subunit PhaE, partial [Steroidobacteraceae bacterium]|nr:poly(R)-hydroxyalkanoic acid synthase subunit PhaE [Steroidobacteraceae bacterium]